ncbi:MAG: hypothetical protein HYV32_05135 [Candidatus Kerfeldbacteria bacterium]|nr:hypothetical protein [Candidatus Kerfeldbacteria bacterium]
MTIEPKQYEIDTASLSYHEASLLTRLNGFYQELHTLVIEQETYQTAGTYPQEFYEKIGLLFDKIQPLIEQNSALRLAEVIGSKEITGQNFAEQQAKEQTKGLQYIIVLLQDIEQQLKPGLEAETIPTEDSELLPLREVLKRTIDDRKEYLRKDQEEFEAWSPGGARYEAEQEYRRQQGTAANERTNRMMDRLRKSNRK